MTVLDETPEPPPPLLSGLAGGGVALGVSVSETTTSLVMMTTTPSCCVLDIWVWLVDVRTTWVIEGEVGVGLVELGLDV